MPELPDLVVYVEALSRRVVGETLQAIQLASPFLLRTVHLPLHAVRGRRVLGLRRLGKRIVFELEDELFVAIYLMIAGRLHWKPQGARVAGRSGLAAFAFSSGTLTLTEAGTRRRAALHLLQGREALQDLDRGGLEPLEASLDAFREALARENHTLKSALTDPRLFSGIGNAYSDEILHRARLSPFALTRNLDERQIAGLHQAARAVLGEWIERLRRETGDGFPERVTAFREQMAVHGRYRKPCPDCGSPVLRIVYAENEANYCAPCQTGGRVLSDRALARLMRDDWPRTIQELEERFGGPRGGAA